ncbi:E3 ubiquitin-protein ligase tom1 [Tilletia horrida]|uniref:HECT-type E3 ubiquitin transferase n=1 Tax=Tilletia horrida TaxID=155126 RepID=A0AAN6GP24_9BASI|nr:E3 ubiquitin-protein ligase tom1 [Tilletia horrida]KAK0564648.1 E3 ubiquitin-protein ligase tom1 [Tilletia horrida]
MGGIPLFSFGPPMTGAAAGTGSSAAALLGLGGSAGSSGSTPSGSGNTRPLPIPLGVGLGGSSSNSNESESGPQSPGFGVLEDLFRSTRTVAIPTTSGSSSAVGGGASSSGPIAGSELSPAMFESAAGAFAELLTGRRPPPGSSPFMRTGGMVGGIPITSSSRHTHGSSALNEASTSAAGKSREAEAAAKKEKEENEEKLKKMYEEFDFRPLWTRLSQALTRLKDNPSAAQVLLPLIESLMVVSKHVIAPETAAAVESRTLTRSSSIPPVTPASEGNDPMTSSFASIASIASTAHGRSPREQMEDHFFAFTERHRKILNIMVRQNPSLMSGSFALLVHNPKVLDFDNKKNYFTQQLHKNRRDHYTPLNLNIRRSEVFGDSQKFFSRYTGPEIKHGRLNVRFLGEEGIDAGGVTREWFSVLARAMFNPDYALFTPCAADRTTYQPNRLSFVDSHHLIYFKFVGRVIGKAIYDGRLLDAYFTRSFYKHILGKPVDYRDMEAVDPEYYKSLEWILENDITDVLDLNFTMDAEDFGETRVIELKPDGATMPVTEENKVEYVRLVTEQRLTQSIRPQIDAFLEGFHDIIPPELIRIFTEQELELLISGLPDIDVDSWKNNTELHGYSSSDAVIQWFWRAVRSFDQTEKAKLLQFITGTSKVPLEGFGHLQGTQGIQKFNIHKAYGADRLPAAHTCFNQLDLPQYESYEKLRSQLLICMNEASEGFGFA